MIEARLRSLPAILLGLCATTSIGYACVCSEPDLPRALAQSEAVFAGKVIKLVRLSSVKLSDGTKYSLRGIVATVRVEDGWKGARRGEKVPVFSGTTSCGYSFEKGRKYLVFARYDQRLGRLATGACHRTRPAESAGSDVEALGKPLKSRRFGLF